MATNASNSQQIIANRTPTGTINNQTNTVTKSNGLLNLNTNLNLTSIILIAKFDYESKEQHELDLKKSERLILIDNTKNWWLVKKCDSDQTGYIPSNYVKKEKKSIFDKIIPRKLGTHNSKSNALTAAPNGINTIATSFPMAIVKHKYTANKIDELTLNVGVKVKVLEKFGDGWWKVSCPMDNDAKESIGLYPSNYLQEDSASNNSSNNSNNVTDSNKSTNSCLPLSNKTEYNNNTNASLCTEKSNETFITNITRSPKISFDTSHTSSQNDPNNTKCESISSNEKEIEYVRVVYPHRARISCEYSNPIILNELTIEVNEILKLIEDDNECLDYDKSWLKVFNSQGITGLIPSNCVQPIVDNQLNDFVFIRRPTAQGIFGNNPWYYGNITRFETIILFNKFATNGDFLVRDSDNGNFSISLKSENLNNKHFKVFFKENKFTIGKKIFYSMDELLDNYHKNPIFDQNGEKLFLIKPFKPPPISKTNFTLASCYDI